jgi:hypothetical protein
MGNKAVAPKDFRLLFMPISIKHEMYKKIGFPQCVRLAGFMEFIAKCFLPLTFFFLIAIKMEM